jgi:F-type H+-transporting ATPase subunit gamma
LARLIERNDEHNHPLFAARAVAKRLIIVMTSDRGLAGAYNATILRRLTHELATDVANGVATSLIVIGQKGAQFASRLEGVELFGVYTNWPTEPTSSDLYSITRTVFRSFEVGEVDRVDLLYTHFTSTIRQEVRLETILPIQERELMNAHTDMSETLQEAAFEPSAYEVINFMVPRLLDAQIFQANLDAIASEHSMRMMAMKNASDNAKEIISDLTLTYNSARQAAITQELSEITAGAEALV